MHMCTYVLQRKVREKRRSKWEEGEEDGSGTRRGEEDSDDKESRVVKGRRRDEGSPFPALFPFPLSSLFPFLFPSLFPSVPFPYLYTNNETLIKNRKSTNLQKVHPPELVYPDSDFS